MLGIGGFSNLLLELKWLRFFESCGDAIGEGRGRLTQIVEGVA